MAERSRCENWISRHVNKVGHESSGQVIEVFKPKIARNVLIDISEPFATLPEAVKRAEKSLGPLHVDRKIIKKDTGSIITVTKSAPTIKETITIKVSANDFNMLYESIDPKKAVIGLEPAGQPVTPDVATWTELYAETVPWPTLWMFLYDFVDHQMKPFPAASGSVSTQHIPTHESKLTEPYPEVVKEKSYHQYTTSGSKVSVKASPKLETEVTSLPEHLVSTVKAHNKKPPKNIRCDSPYAQWSRQCKEHGERTALGYTDGVQKR